MKRSRKITFAVVAVAIILIGLTVVGEAALRLAAREHTNLVRTPPEVFNQKDLFKVLCIGDSFTFGIGADGPDSYPDQLQGMLEGALGKGKVKVINWGLPAQNSSEALLALQSFLQEAPTRPDVVCLAIGVNNFWNWHLSTALQKKGTPLEKIDAALTGVRIYRFFKILLGHGPTRAGRFYTKHNPALGMSKIPPSTGEEEEERLRGWLEADLEECVKLCRKHRVRLVLVGYHRSSPYVFVAMENVSNLTGATYVDNHDILTAGVPSPNPYLSEDGWHPGAKGYRVIAQRVAKVLLVDCPD